MTDLILESHDHDDSAEAKIILAKLVEFNRQFRRAPRREFCAYFKNDQSEVIAGLNATSDWDWMFVKHLWVHEDYRLRGLAKKLVVAAEDESHARKLRGIWIDAFNPEAVALYQKLGFEKFGELPDHPKGFARTFLAKHLP